MPNEELYHRIRKTLEIFAKVNNRLEVYGLENVPEAGGALLCPVHENYSDPFYVGVALRSRMLHFLAWHGIDEMPVVGPLFREIGTMHPIHESYGVATDRDELKQVMGQLRELLEAGEVCVIFPSGCIKHWIRPRDMGEPKFKHGACRLAAQAGVPIIPVGLLGTRWVVPNIVNYYDWGGPDKGFWIPGALPVKVKVKFGAPFHVDPAAAEDREIAQAEADRLQEIVYSLREELKPGNIFNRLFDR